MGCALPLALVRRLGAGEAHYLARAPRMRAKRCGRRPERAALRWGEDHAIANRLATQTQRALVVTA